MFNKFFDNRSLAMWSSDLMIQSQYKPCHPFSVFFHTWHRMSLLRTGVKKQLKTQTQTQTPFSLVLPWKSCITYSHSTQPCRWSLINVTISIRCNEDRQLSMIYMLLTCLLPGVVSVDDVTHNNNYIDWDPSGWWSEYVNPYIPTDTSPWGRLK